MEHQRARKIDWLKWKKDGKAGVSEMELIPMERKLLCEQEGDIIELKSEQTGAVLVRTVSHPLKPECVQANKRFSTFSCSLIWVHSS